MTRQRTIPAELWRIVLERDGGRCRKCQRTEALQGHHIRAVVDGGEDELNNLIALCSPCHREWHIVTETTRLGFLDWLGYPPVSDLLVLFKLPWPEGLNGDALKATLLLMARAHGESQRA